jgi:hypothetical protein
MQSAIGTAHLAATHGATVGADPREFESRASSAAPSAADASRIVFANRENTAR